MPKVGDILRAFIRNAGHIVFVNEHNCGVMVIGRGQFLYIDDGAVGDAARSFQPRASFFLEFVGRLRFAPQ